MQTETESPVTRTARNIAYALIAIYGLTLVSIGIIAATKAGTDADVWVELLKSGFLILGGGLTTIIGYYFGSRGVQEAQDTAELARSELEKVNAQFQKFKREFSPTSDEDALILPEEEE